MNKVIPALIISLCALPALAQSNYQIRQDMARQVESHCWNNNQPTCTYHGYQSNQSPSIQYNQPITRAQYPITIDQKYQSPYVYNP